MKTDIFKQACKLHTSHMVARYLMSNAEGRWDGAEKALRHIQLCQFYVCVFTGYNDPDTVRRKYEVEYQAVHSKTQELTDYLDTEIGFPIKGRPDYDTLEPLFFEKFHKLAVEALTTKVVCVHEENENKPGCCKKCGLYIYRNEV